MNREETWENRERPGGSRRKTWINMEDNEKNLGIKGRHHQQVADLENNER